MNQMLGRGSFQSASSQINLDSLFWPQELRSWLWQCGREMSLGKGSDRAQGPGVTMHIGVCLVGWLEVEDSDVAQLISAKGFKLWILKKAHMSDLLDCCCFTKILPDLIFQCYFHCNNFYIQIFDFPFLWSTYLSSLFMNLSGEPPYLDKHIV